MSSETLTEDWGKTLTGVGETESEVSADQLDLIGWLWLDRSVLLSHGPTLALSNTPPAQPSSLRQPLF